MIQKYEETARQRIAVSVAASDLGVGMRASLAARHGAVQQLSQRLSDDVAAVGGPFLRVLGGDRVERAPDRPHQPFFVRAWLRRNSALTFEKASSIGERSGE